MENELTLRERKRQAMIIARELCYPTYYIDKIAKAQNEFEVTHILREARTRED